jgi:hypothetical protein
MHRQILRLFLDRLELMERQMGVLDVSIAAALQLHQDAVVRLAAVPGLGADSAQQIIAELGPQAATFPSPQELASWVGVCPGREESAEVSKSDESPKGNGTMRRVLNQAANSARKTKGSIFQALYQRWVPRLGHNTCRGGVYSRLRTRCECRSGDCLGRSGTSLVIYGEHLLFACVLGEGGVLKQLVINASSGESRPPSGAAGRG